MAACLLPGESKIDHFFCEPWSCAGRRVTGGSGEFAKYAFESVSLGTEVFTGNTLTQEVAGLERYSIYSGRNTGGLIGEIFIAGLSTGGLWVPTTGIVHVYFP